MRVIELIDRLSQLEEKHLYGEVKIVVNRANQIGCVDAEIRGLLIKDNVEIVCMIESEESNERVDIGSSVRSNT